MLSLPASWLDHKRSLAHGRDHTPRNSRLVMRWLQLRKLRLRLQETDPSDRADAVEQLGEFDDVSAHVVKALQDEDPLVRSRAADMLVRCRDCATLVTALADPNPFVRTEAADALGDLRDPTAVPALIVALEDETASVRSHAAYALGDIGDLEAVGPLTTLLSDPAPAVRRIATYALGNLGDPAAIEALMMTLADPEPEVRSAASEAVHKLEGSRTGVFAAVKDDDPEP